MNCTEKEGWKKEINKRKDMMRILLIIKEAAVADASGSAGIPDVKANTYTNKCVL